MVHVIGWSVKGPDELLVREACAEWRAWEGAAGDHLVSHHLETVEHGDGVGRESKNKDDKGDDDDNGGDNYNYNYN